MKNKCKMCNERESICKDLCDRCYTRNWRKNNPKKVKAQAKRDYHKNKEKRMEYVVKNKERITELKSNWYQKNKEELKEYQKVYRKGNKELIKKLNKDYNEKHPEIRVIAHDKRNFGGYRIKALVRDNFTCQICYMTEEEHLKKWNYSLIVHHKDGKGWGKKDKNNSLSNLQTLCKVCHGKEHGRNKREKITALV